MIERTTAREWLLLIASGVVVLIAWALIPTTGAVVLALALVLLIGGALGLAWRLLGDR